MKFLFHCARQTYRKLKQFLCCDVAASLCAIGHDKILFQKGHGILNQGNFMSGFGNICDVNDVAVLETRA